MSRSPAPGDVRMRGFRHRVDVAVALDMLRERIDTLPPEDVSVFQVAGRVLAGATRATGDVPPFDRSAMDGYAVRGEETFGASAYDPIPLELVGEALPGRGSAARLESGQAVRIMTGAPIPPGADAVVMAEHARERTEGSRLLVDVSEAVAPGRHVGRRGEDVRAGQDILPAGRLLRPQDAGLLSATGHAHAAVVRRPRVAILVTGDEVLAPDAPAAEFAVRDANSPMLLALARRDGALVDEPVRVRDDRDLVREALGQLASNHDLILTSGGSSVGSEDHLPTLVAELGELWFHGVALRPASPTGCGRVDGAVVALLPGNPVSCLCAYDVFAGRAIRGLGGRTWELPYRMCRVRLARKIASAVGRVDYVRVTLGDDGRATPLATSGASILSSTTRADGFVLVDRDSEGAAPGDEVEVLLYD